MAARKIRKTGLERSARPAGAENHAPRIRQEGVPGIPAGKARPRRSARQGRGKPPGIVQDRMMCIPGGERRRLGRSSLGNIFWRRAKGLRPGR